MAKAPTLRQQYEKIEKQIEKMLSQENKGLFKLPKKPKKITQKHIKKLEEIKFNIKKGYPHSGKIRKDKFKEKKTEQQKSQDRSRRMKEYWDKLKKENPQKWKERIDKLHGKYEETPHYDNSNIGQIPLDLEEKPDENGFFINKDSGEVFDNYKDWQASLSNPPSYDPFKPDDEEVPLWDDLVISNFMQDVYARPTLNGSRFILNWIDTLISEYGKSMVSAMIEFAKQEGFEIDVKMLYEEDKSSAMATGFMQFWYKKGFFADDESIKSSYDPMRKIRKKMDKEFQGEQYTFGTSLMKAIEGDINADESMQNYG